MGPTPRAPKPNTHHRPYVLCILNFELFLAPEDISYQEEKDADAAGAADVEETD